MHINNIFFIYLFIYLLQHFKILCYLPSIYKIIIYNTYLNSNKW